MSTSRSTRAGFRSPLDTWYTRWGSETIVSAATASVAEATRSTGTTSRTTPGPTGNRFWPRSAIRTSGALVVKPSFQPVWGNESALSTTAGRTIERATPSAPATS